MLDKNWAKEIDKFDMEIFNLIPEEKPMAVVFNKSDLNTNNETINWIPETIGQGRFGDWLKNVQEGDIISVPVSHGEGRFLCDDALLNKLRQNGQIATQYVDLSGIPSMDVDHNPNGSAWAIEGITSPDGRILGKMGHSERFEDGVFRNIPEERYQPLFENAVRYFRKK